MKRRLLYVAGLLTLVLGLSGIHTRAQSGEMTIKSGTVVSSTQDSLVIKTDAGEQVTFVVDSQSILPASLSAGTRVTVEAHALADGSLHAAEVTTGSEANAGTAYRSGEDLPGTASALALLGLAGLVALGAGLGLRLLWGRTALPTL